MFTLTEVYTKTPISCKLILFVFLQTPLHHYTPIILTALGCISITVLHIITAIKPDYLMYYCYHEKQQCNSSAKEGHTDILRSWFITEINDIQMDKRERFKISCVVMETLTGSPGRPLGPKSPSSPWKDTKKQQGWKDADCEVTDVLRSVWNHFKFCSHIFIPSLHPLLEVLGVPSLLCHPGETQSRRVRSQNNSQTDIQVLSYYTYSKPNNTLLPLLPLVTIIILCEVYGAF